MREPLRLLAVFPHPDDETLGCGTVLARCAEEGVEVHLLTATRGQMGWSGPHGSFPGAEVLGRMREKELRCAAEKLGITAVHLLDYMDGQLERVGQPQLIDSVAAVIRAVRPQVVITYAQEGIYGHPDHIALAQAVSGALVSAADGSYADAQKQPAHRVAKYYAVVDSREAVRRFTELAGAVEMEMEGQVRRHVGWEEWAITTRFDARPYFARIDGALHCHQSQFASFGRLLELPPETRMELFGEATLVRNYSLVKTSPRETDLFEGLRG